MIQRIYPLRGAEIARKALLSNSIGHSWNSYRRPFVYQSDVVVPSNTVGNITKLPMDFRQIFAGYNMYVVDRVGINVYRPTINDTATFEYQATLADRKLSDSYLPAEFIGNAVGVTTLGWLARMPEKIVIYSHDALSIDIRTLTAGLSDDASVSVQLHGQILGRDGANSAMLYQRMARRREIIRPYTVTMKDQAISLGAGTSLDVLVTPPDAYVCVNSLYFLQTGATSSNITASISSPNSRFQMMNSPMVLSSIPSNVQDEYQFPEPFWITPSSRMIVRLESTDGSACKVWMAMRGSLVRKEHITEAMRMIEEGDGL